MMYEYVSGTSTRGLPYVLLLLLSPFAYATHARYVAVSSVQGMLIVCMYPLRSEIYATLGYHASHQYLRIIYMQEFEPG